MGMFVLVMMTFINRANAALTIEITEGVKDSIPIAVVPFKWMGSSALSEDKNVKIARAHV